MRKNFIGEVLHSEINEFTDARGEFVSLWRLGVMLTDDRGITFNVSQKEDLFETVRYLKPGQNVNCTAEPEIRMDGRLKWRLIDVVLLD